MGAEQCLCFRLKEGGCPLAKSDFRVRLWALDRQPNPAVPLDKGILMNILSQQDKRGTHRREFEFPLDFLGGKGMTRNISSGGLLFETLEPFELHRRFSFTLFPFHSPPVHGLAEVVRTVALEDHFEVAARIAVIAVDDSTGSDDL